MNASPTLIVLCAAVALGACGRSRRRQAPVDTAEIIGAIKADEVHWNSDYKSGDAGVLAGHYAPDRDLDGPGRRADGRNRGDQGGAREALADKAFTLTFASDKVDVSASGDLAAARGTYTRPRPIRRPRPASPKKGPM